MKPEIMVKYDSDMPLSITASNVVNCSMHYHMNMIEIIYVMSGIVEIKSCFENFNLKAGDFIIVNQEDFHNIKGNGKDNIVLSLFIDLTYFEKSVKYIRYINFACESFTIKDDREEYVDRIRTLINNAAATLTAKGEGYRAAAVESVEQIMSILVDHFTLLQHFSSDQKLNSKKIEQYYRISEMLEERYQHKTLHEDIPKSEFYSKYYLAHLYKGMMLMSIQESLSAVRCFKSEKLLLTTDQSIQEISLECGFSDAKYYYKHFKRWYDCTPGQYRKQYQAEVYKENITEPIEQEKLLKLLAAFCSSEKQKHSNFVTNAEGIEFFEYAMIELFGKIRSSNSRQSVPGDPNWKEVGEILLSIRNAGLKPSIIMEFETRTSAGWLHILKTCCHIYGKEIDDWEFCFCYTNPDMKVHLSELNTAIRKIHPSIRIKTLLRWNGAVN